MKIQGSVGEGGVYWGASPWVVSRQGTALGRFHTLFYHCQETIQTKLKTFQDNA